MPNYNGNPGNKGGGRKSAYQEKNTAELLWSIWHGKISREKALKKVSSGKYSVQDMFIVGCYQGNEKYILALFGKTFPDTVLEQRVRELAEIVDNLKIN